MINGTNLIEMVTNSVKMHYLASVSMSDLNDFQKLSNNINLNRTSMMDVLH